MRKKTFSVIGILAGLLALSTMLTGCYGTTDTTTDATGGTSSFFVMIGFLVLMFVLMYFLTIRPQRKRQKEQALMMGNLQRGDKVITIGGIMGEIESVSDDSIVIKIEDGAKMRFVKSAIATKVTGQQEQTGPVS